MNQEVDIKTEDKPPTHVIADWNYFQKHVDGRMFQIRSYFDLENWKINAMYRMRISHSYDPSHFWVVSKESEVDALHKYLHHFYSKYKLHYKIPQKSFKLNMYCIAFTEGAFYRAVLENVPEIIKNQGWAYVFLIDFGFMAKVSVEDIYFMTTKLYTVPQFAIRATLSGMGPLNSTSWSSDLVSKFNRLVCNKILLCQVTNKNYAHKILYLKLGEYNWQRRCLESIDDILVTEKLVKPMSILDIRDMKHSEKRKKLKRSKKSKLPFLSPTFEEIEKAACVDTVLFSKYLEEFVGK